MKKDKGKRKKSVQRSLMIVCLIGTLIVQVFPSQKVFAGDINSNETRLLQVAQQTFEYNGKTYRASSEYIAMAREILMRDDVDLTAEEVSQAISEVYSNIATGITEGYLYEVEPSTGGADSSTDDGNSVEEEKKEGNQGSSSQTNEELTGAKNDTKTGDDTKTGVDTKKEVDTKTEVDTKPNTSSNSTKGETTDNDNKIVDNAGKNPIVTKTPTKDQGTDNSITKSPTSTEGTDAEAKNQTLDNNNENNLSSNLEEDVKEIGGDVTSSNKDYLEGVLGDREETSTDALGEVGIIEENVDSNQANSQDNIQSKDENENIKDEVTQSTSEEQVGSETTIEAVTDKEEESLTVSMITAVVLLVLFIGTIIIAYQVGRNSHEKK